MTLFRIISTLVIVGLLGTMAYDLRRRVGSWKSVGEFLSHHGRFATHDLRMSRKSLKWRERLRRVTYVASAALGLLLALSGFLPVLFTGGHLSGILLVFHVTIAPLFALSLSALALLWAHRMSFDEADWRCAEGLTRWESPGREVLVTLALKVGFWIILSLSLPLMLTIILGLFPLFGTDGESLLIRFHGYSALLLLATALTEIYLTIVFIERTTESISKEQST